MKLRLNIFLTISLLITTLATERSYAQLPGNSPRTMVRSGLIERIDSSRLRAAEREKFRLDSIERATPDSVFVAQLEQIRVRQESYADSLQNDSITRKEFSNADSLKIHYLDSLLAARAERASDTLMDAKLDSLSLIDSTKQRRGSWFMPDSMGLSQMCWASAVLPGYGQVYNKQYWKLPILYGTLGAGLSMFFVENKTYKPLKKEYDAQIMVSLDRTPELDALQTKMIRSNTRRQLYLGAALASYIYFLGDAAVNYSTNEESNVKKATTLACICPGAGQIYNKSYWKLPFVVGGFATMIYVVDWNNRGYQRYKLAYGQKAAYDADPEAYPNGSPDEFRGRYSLNDLQSRRDSFRRNRDLSIIMTAGMYILQIVDAHVDAHLKDYDISDDLAMTIEPNVGYGFNPTVGRNNATFGFNIGLKF